MTITIKGKNKSEVQDRVNEIIDNIEKQQKFDHRTEICKMEGGWQGTVEIHWHTESYPSDYKTGKQPKLSVGEKAVAVDRIYNNHNIRKG